MFMAGTKGCNVHCTFCASTVSVSLDTVVIDDVASVYRTRCGKGHLVERELTIESRALLRDHQVMTVADHMSIAHDLLTDDDAIWQALGVGASD